ncbi:hypothetical protein Acr_28g0015070 [Actinidia rufa]|uniref:Uncharacterized protein n=1 Tax=Actinidia rufa TaxID=165716 RepID=A0A7J0HCR2_9ERIC|nr:hypothetical protein Acr_28g0015070 [Actinidia rufa]
MASKSFVVCSSKASILILTNLLKSLVFFNTQSDTFIPSIKPWVKTSSLHPWTVISSDGYINATGEQSKLCISSPATTSSISQTLLWTRSPPKQSSVVSAYGQNLPSQILCRTTYFSRERKSSRDRHHTVPNVDLKTSTNSFWAVEEPKYRSDTSPCLTAWNLNLLHYLRNIVRNFFSLSTNPSQHLKPVLRFSASGEGWPGILGLVLHPTFSYPFPIRGPTFTRLEGPSLKVRA